MATSVSKPQPPTWRGVDVKKSLGQGRGTERVARWPRRQPCQVRQRARAPWAVGRSPRVEACAGCAQWGQTICYDSSKPLPPTWRGVGEEEPRPTEWGGASRFGREDNHAKSASKRVLRGRSAGFSTRRSARGPRATGVKYGGQYVSKPQPSTLRGVGVGGTLANVGGGARRASGRENNHAKSASAHVGSWPFFTGRSARVSRATGVKQMTTTFRSIRRRPGTVPAKISLGQRRRVGRAAPRPQTQPRQVRQQARAPWVVGWFSTWRSASGLCATRAKGGGRYVLKPQPPAWRGVGEEEPRPTAWKKTTPSPPASEYSVGRRLVLHEAKRPRVAQHGSKPQ